jgi:hypothetical protein
MLRIPNSLDNRVIDGGKVVSPTHQPHFTPHKCHPDVLLRTVMHKDFAYVFGLFLYFFTREKRVGRGCLMVVAVASGK